MHAARERLRPPLAVDHGRETHEHHRQGGQKQRRANDRPDRDVARAGLAPDDGDDRDQRLGKGGGDRRENAPNRALPKPRLAPEPLDRVCEQERAREEDREARQQQNNGAHGLGAPRGERGDRPCVSVNGTSRLRKVVTSSDSWRTRLAFRDGFSHVSRKLTDDCPTSSVSRTGTNACKRRRTAAA